jgi:hypothetical protein
MSQGGINKITGSILPPDVPLQFTTDAGVVIPAANNVNVFGGVGFNTSGAGSTITLNLDTPVALANGGTGVNGFTNVDGVIYYDGTVLSSTGVGTAGQILMSNGPGLAPAFGPVSGSSIMITGDVGSASSGAFTITGGTTGLTTTMTGTTLATGGTLIVANGGTGQPSLTNHGVLVGAGTTAITQLTVGATNTVLLGNTGADPSFGQVPNAALVNSSITLTSGTGITVTGSPVALGNSATIALTTPVSIANGGANNTTYTTDGTLYFDGTKFNSTATGTSGWVLTSGGTGVAPSYQVIPSSSISITGDTGGAQTGSSFTFQGGTTGLSFGGSSDTFTTTFAGITANGGTVNLATDATTSAINIGTGAGNKTTTLGSTNTGSTTDINSGTGGTTINSASTGFVVVGAGAEFGVTTSSTGIIQLESGASGAGILITTQGSHMQLQSGTGVFDISNDAVATTVNIATAAAAKTVILGSTNTTSGTTIQSGSGNIIMNSGPTISSAGIMKNSVQPCFTAYLNGTITNATGDSTLVNPLIFNGTLVNQGSGYSTSTGGFTAPVTGNYMFNVMITFNGLTSSHTTLNISLGTTAEVYSLVTNPGVAQTSGNNCITWSVVAPMTSGNVANIALFVAGGSKVVGFVGSSSTTRFCVFSGYLLC